MASSQNKGLAQSLPHVDGSIAEDPNISALVKEGTTYRKIVLGEEDSSFILASSQNKGLTLPVQQQPNESQPHKDDDALAALKGAGKAALKGAGYGLSLTAACSQPAAPITCPLAIAAIAANESGFTKKITTFADDLLAEAIVSINPNLKNVRETIDGFSDGAIGLGSTALSASLSKVVTKGLTTVRSTNLAEKSAAREGVRQSNKETPVPLRSRSEARRTLERTIRETDDHSLKFLLNSEGKFHKTRGLKHSELFETPYLVQMGHVESKLLGGKESIILQSAWENQLASQTIERSSIGGAVLHTPTIYIEGVPVSHSTAKSWEDLGFLIKGTVDKALGVTFK